MVFIRVFTPLTFYYVGDGEKVIFISLPGIDKGSGGGESSFEEGEQLLDTWMRYDLTRLPKLENSHPLRYLIFCVTFQKISTVKIS